jgi:tRNA A37 threonylcarbamoyladenosine biosynthesis protein TsaE
MKAYIAGTYSDLREYREAAIDALLHLKYDVVDMATFKPSEGTVLSTALDAVGESDIFVVILGWRYGSIPEGTDRSLTELEYHEAVDLGKACFGFLLDEDVPWPRGGFDRDLNRIEMLRNDLKNRQICVSFTSPEDLAQKVAIAVQRFQIEIKPDYPSTESSVFDATTLFRYYERLRQRYDDLSVQDLRLRLSDIFVEPWLTEMLYRPEKTFNSQEARRRIMEIMDHTDGQSLVILGGPGIGKTVLARYITLNLAEENRAAQGSLGNNIPLFIQLRDYVMAVDHADGFIGYWDFLESSGGIGLPAAQLAAFLHAGGRAVAVFDGLDEVTDLRLWRQMVEEIAAFAQEHAQVRVIVTSRVVGYLPDVLRSAGFRHFRLEEFDEMQVRDFLQRYDQACQTGKYLYRTSESRSALSEIQQSSFLSRLAGNPLVLTMMASIVGRFGRLPRSGFELYEEATSLLLEDWDKRRSIVGPSRLSLHDRKSALGDLAFEVMSESANNVDNISEDRVFRVFEGNFVRRHEIDPGRARQIAEELLDGFKSRTSVLIECAPNLYRFAHRGFREFFCARFIIDGFRTDSLTRDQLRSIAIDHRNDPAWEPVLEMVAEVMGENLLLYELGDVFKMNGVPKLTFVEPTEFTRFLMILRQSGRGVVIEGPSGIGKTTFMRQAEQRELGRGVEIKILSARKKSDLAMIRALPDGHDGIVAVDDFHRLDPGIRDELSDYLKLLADEESESRLIIIGIPGVGRSLVALSFDLATRIEVFRLTRAPDEAVEEMIEKGEKSLNISFAHRDSIISMAHGSLLTAQMLCWNVAQRSGIERTVRRMRELDTPTEDALRLVRAGLAKKYDGVIRKFSLLDGDRDRVCVYLLKKLAETEEGILSLDAAARERPDLAAGIETHLLQIFPGGFDEDHADVEQHLSLDPIARQLIVEDPQFLFYLQGLDFDQLAEAVGKRPPRRQVFISYSHADELWMKKLKVHLDGLAGRGRIDYWCDKEIATGHSWRYEIQAALERAAVGVLLITPKFLESPFIRDVEIRRLLERASSDGCEIWALIVKPSVYTEVPELASFQAFNEPSAPLSGMTTHKQDKVLSEIVLTLAKAFPTQE